MAHDGVRDVHDVRDGDAAVAHDGVEVVRDRDHVRVLLHVLRVVVVAYFRFVFS